jgi:hypothetical protein
MSMYGSLDSQGPKTPTPGTRAAQEIIHLIQLLAPHTPFHTDPVRFLPV